MFLPILCYTTKNRRRKRAKGLAPWIPSAARALNALTGDVVSLNETSDRQKSGGRIVRANGQFVLVKW